MPSQVTARGPAPGREGGEAALEMAGFRARHGACRLGHPGSQSPAGRGACAAPNPDNIGGVGEAPRGPLWSQAAVPA